MKTSGVSCEPKFGLLGFLGHPNGHQYLALCFDFFSGKTGTTNNASELKTSSILHVLRLVANICLKFYRKATTSKTFLYFTLRSPLFDFLFHKHFTNIIFHLLIPRLLLVGMAKRQTFRHVTRWQGTAGLKTSIISLAVLLV